MIEANDDDWQELVRELGLDDAPVNPPSKPGAKSTREHSAHEETVVAAEEIVYETELEPEAVDEEADSFAHGVGAEVGQGEESEGSQEDEEPEGEGENEEGVPGSGKKRRRRRRRKKKGAGSDEAIEGAEPVPAPVPKSRPQTPLPARQPVMAASAEHDDRDGDADDDMIEEESGGGSRLAIEDDTGSDALRELIATWNVPSWDEIITGLHRPDR